MRHVDADMLSSVISGSVMEFLSFSWLGIRMKKWLQEGMRWFSLIPEDGYAHGPPDAWV